MMMPAFAKALTGARFPRSVGMSISRTGGSLQYIPKINYDGLDLKTTNYNNMKLAIPTRELHHGELFSAAVPPSHASRKSHWYASTAPSKLLCPRA